MVSFMQASSTKMILLNSSWKALEETIEMKMMNTASSFPSSSSSSSFSLPLSKLKEFFLCKIESLLEEWFKNLTSLKLLEIWGCPNLTSLPKGISHLTSLQSLAIINHPQLKQRRKKENGEDWDKISHIRNHPKSQFSKWGIVFSCWFLLFECMATLSIRFHGRSK